MKLACCLAIACVLGLFPGASRAALIDTFATPQVVTGPEPPYSGHSAIDVADPIPANRNIGVGGSVPADSATGSIGAGSLSFSVPVSGVYVTMGVAWSLGPLDITDGGAATVIPIYVVEQTLETDLAVAVGSCGPGPFCANARSQVVIPLTGVGAYFIPLSAFADAAPFADAPADLTALTLIGLQLIPPPDTAPGSVRILGPLQTIPEPATSPLALLGASLIGWQLTRRRRSTAGRLEH